MIRIYFKSTLIIMLSLLLASCGTSKTVVSPTNFANFNNTSVKNTATNKIEHTIPTTTIEKKELTLPEKLQKAKDEGFVFTKSDEIVFLAKENIGIKYLYGGTTTKGMDCSGMVYTTFKHAEIEVPRSSRDLANYGMKIKKEEALPGDLIFFKTNGRSVINHVGIITEVTKDNIKFVHASTSKGVIISSLAETYYSKAFVQINRILNN